MKKNSFTLAEVLIVLSIIGIVAAITIPALINKIDIAKSKSGWKKAYSTLNQANLALLNDNGGTFAGLCDGSINVNICLRDSYAQYLKVIKKCDTNAIAGNCWAKNFTRMNGAATWSVENLAGIVLNDGTFILFSMLDKNCNNHAAPNFYNCGSISVDINGLKKPNAFGKDIFFVNILKNSIKPFGTDGDWLSTNDYYNCSPNSDGEKCSAEYLKE